MDLSLLKNKDAFPLHVQRVLENKSIDYGEKHLSISSANSSGAKQLEAGIVLLLHYKDSEFVFQLIKRSESVAQAGDISCPGGILEGATDELLEHLLIQTDLLHAFDGQSLKSGNNYDDYTASLIRLFLMNALREAWEEIGLSPLNVSFLGALPTYSLTYFARTIFPLVCFVRKEYDFKISPEVEKVIEIPVNTFFNPDSYALMEIESQYGKSDPRYNIQFPCLIIPGTNDQQDILWGATFNIITSFLQVIAGSSFPSFSSSRIVKRTLSANYSSGNR